MANRKNDFISSFKSLKSILKKYEKSLRVIADSNDNYCLNAGYDAKRKANIFFGAVQIKKNYVSFHLMPFYVNPNLLQKLSPELKKRMQGKSCFNFKVKEKKLITELSMLTKNGFEFYKKNGML
jgi:hypothetical protein